MRRQLLLVFVLVGMLLQGGFAASVQVLHDPVTQSHCGGVTPAPADGDCCPDACDMSASCAAYCQTAEAPFALVMPVRPAAQGALTAGADLESPNPAYIPALPPPIA
jgi:hypothetical protein